MSFNITDSAVDSRARLRQVRDVTANGHARCPYIHSIAVDSEQPFNPSVGAVSHFGRSRDEREAVIERVRHSRVAAV